MSGRGPARQGLGRFGLVVVAVLAVLALPVLGTTVDLAEDRLDVSLKLLYRAQKAVSAHDAPRAELEAPNRDRALLAVERVRGASSFGRTAPKVGRAGSARLSLLVKYVGERSGLEAAGFEIEAQLGHLYTGTLDPELLAGLAEAEGVRSVQTSRTLRASGVPAVTGPVVSPPAAAAFAPSGPSSDAPIGPRVLSGAGALVAFIDTGVDVRHQDFRKGDGTTRIKYLLDFSDPGDTDGDGDLDGSGPYGGTLYTEAQINAALSGGGIGERDSTGHGTHGLSVAAGDDPVFPGVAPAADLLVVKATREDGSLGFLSNDVVNALAFVDQKAQELGLPYVVNLSLGTLVSAHDGRSLEEQAIDALVGPGKAGKVAVVAAGNSSENRTSRFHHLSGTSYPGLSRTHTLTLPAYTATPGQGNDRVLLDLWHEGADRHTIAVTPPGGSIITVPFGNYADVETAQGNVFVANLGGPSPDNGDVEAIILIDDWAGTPPAAGTWTITVTGEQVGDTGVYHAWLADDSRLGTQEPYLSGNADNRSLVGKPGAAFGAITVGSFARHDPATRFRTSWTDLNAIGRTDTTAVLEDISDFSSPGPTRDGRVKPEVTAPGERVLGAVSADALPCSVSSSIYLFHPFAECDGLLTDESTNHAFGLLQGTSFSAPVVTGLAARILSTNPTLDAIQVRNILINTASSAAPVGTVPNDAWGYGKVDLGVGGVILPQNVRITTDTLPAGVLTKAYAQVFTAAGGTLPYSWSLASGSLPPGLTLDAGGLLTGTPTTANTYNFTVQVTDTSVPTQSATRSYSLVIAATAALQVVTSGLPVGRIDLAYSEVLQGEGGTLPYTWAIVGGTLPAGLSLLANGTLQGTPTELGRRDFTVRLTDATAAAVVRALSIKVVGQGGEDWTPLGKTRPTVNQIAVDPNNPQHLITSTRNIDAIFESTNGGDSWRPNSINAGLQGPAWQLAFSPISSTAWAIADISASHPQGLNVKLPQRWDPITREWLPKSPCPGTDVVVSTIEFDESDAAYLVHSGGPCTIYSVNFLSRSTDGGDTWSILGELPRLTYEFYPGVLGSFSYLGVARSNPNFVYASRGFDESGGPGTFHNSLDGGRTWNDVRQGTIGMNDVQVSRTDPLDVVKAYRAQLQTVDRTVDGGRTWSTSSPLPDSTYNEWGCCIRRSFSNPALVLFGTTRGVFKSTDHGGTWGSNPILSRRATAMAIDPTNANVFYVASADGLFKSTDGGSSWESKTTGLVRRTLGSVRVSPTEPTTVVVSAAEGPYVSRTSGDSWTLSSSGIPTPSPSRVAVSPADPLLMYLGSEDGVYRSENRGVTWLPTDPSPAAGDRVVALDADPFDAGVAIVGLGGTKGLFRSTDRGQTWAGASAGLPFTEPTDLDFARDVAGRAYVSLATNGIYRSDNKGTTWSAFGLNAQTVNAVEPAPSNSSYVYAASGATMYLFDPGVGSWTAATTGPASPITTLAVDAAQPLTAYAGADHPGTAAATGGIYKTTDGGRNWARLTGVLDQFDVVSLATHPTVSGTLYAATLNGGAYRSVDGGLSWTELPNYGTVGDLTNVTVKHPSDVLLYAGTEGYGIQVSSDGGRTFAPRVAGLSNLNVNAIAFEPGSATVMYVGTDAGVFKSTDAGNTWAATGQVTGEITDLLTDSEGTARRIWATVRGLGIAYSSDAGASFTVHSTGLATLELTSLDLETVGTARRIWATTKGGDGVYFSDDLGGTWKPAAGTGLLNRSVNDLTVEKGSARRIWATTDNGVFYSNNDGLVWTGLSLGLPTGVPVTSVSLDPGTGEALVSLFSPTQGGVYRGGNVNGTWTAFNSGLDVLTVRRLTNDGGHTLGPGAMATTFYASTAGDGSYAADVRGVVSLMPTIVTPGLPNGAVGIPYLKTLVAAGGTPPYTWRVVEGSLPPGVTLASTGLLSGTPTQAGPYALTVQVSDSAARGDRKAFSMTVGTLDEPRSLNFYSVSPCRLIDTRDPTGPLGGPALQASTARTFSALGACGVPSTAKAVSANLTVTSPSTAGDLRLYPAGVAQPLVSSMNYGPGQTRANSATLPLGTSGAFTVICAQATGTVHFILDVNGYFQ